VLDRSKEKKSVMEEPTPAHPINSLNNRPGSRSWLPPGPLSTDDRIVRLLWGFSLLGGILYLVLPSSIEGPARVAIKGMGVGLLAALVFRVIQRLSKPVDGWILAVALSFSCLGDLFLAVRGTFLLGLSSFLVTHLLYLALFVRNWRRPLRPTRTRLVISILVLLFSLFYSQWLAPSLGSLAMPVALYVCAITLMVVAGLWSSFSPSWVWVGAILFLVSDAILAADRFRAQVPFAGFLIWATYYLGQYGIALGILHAHWSHQEKEIS
jgi:uncharacterized membrane protein YhhN